MINQQPAYSHLFSCLYDEPGPVGQLGRGTHHSVFRSVQWRDIGGGPIEKGRVHDFAVIWDEDHDTRVMQVAERLHLAGLLWPVVFIGERKAILTVLFAQMAGPLQDATVDTIGQVQAIAEEADESDNWCFEWGWFHRSTVPEEGNRTVLAGLVGGGSERAVAYLQGIDALWELGEKPFLG